MHAHIADEITNLTIFVLSFHQVPITAGWPEAMWIPKLAQGFHGWAVPGIEPPDPLITGPRPEPLDHPLQWIFFSPPEASHPGLDNAVFHNVPGNSRLGTLCLTALG
jgi:hypothetical protein